MATVIDALIVTLGLDASKFKQGQNQAADSTKKFKEQQDQASRAIAANAKSMADGFRSVRNELMGLIALGLGANGFKSFIESQVKGQAQLGYLSRNLGMQARELDAWGKAVRTVGGTAEGFQQSVQAIASGIEQFKLTGESDVVSTFRALNISIGDGKNLRSYKDILLDTANALQKYGPQDQIRIGQMLGVDPSTLNLLRQGRGAVEALYGEMYAASNVSGESAKRAQETQKAWAGFTAQVNGVGQAVFDSMAPALVEATQELTKLGKWVNDHHDEIGGFFTDLVKDAKDLTSEVKELGGATEGWTTKLGAAAAAILLLGGRVKWLSRLAAVGGAYFLGEKVGEYINKNYVEGTKGGELIGSAVAHVKALLGDNEAKQAIEMTAAANGQIRGGKDKASYVIDYFESKGWTRAQAAGIASNLSVESGFNPKAVGDNGNAYGVAQWHPDRQENFKAFAGKDIRNSSLEEQLAFIHHELTAGNERAAGDALRKSRTASEAGGIVSEKYERPKEKEFESSRRAVLAQSIHEKIPGESIESLARMSPEEQAVFERDRLSARQDEARIAADSGKKSSPPPKAPPASDAMAELLASLRPLSAPSLPVGAAASAPQTVNNATTSTTTNEVNIGQLTVHTQATDAQSMASDLPRQLEQNALINMAASGMR